jgi:hypothetical protein
MSMLAGPFAASAMVLAVGGAMKARRPEPTVGALRALNLPHSAVLVRVIGVLELVLGTSALAFDNRALAGLVGASYAVFAAFVLLALRRGTMLGSCGCFGRRDTPPTRTHVVLNIAFAGVAAAVALDPDPRVSLATATRDGLLTGVSFLVLTAATAGLVYLAFTSLAQLHAVRR